MHEWHIRRPGIHIRYLWMLTASDTFNNSRSNPKIIWDSIPKQAWATRLLRPPVQTMLCCMVQISTSSNSVQLVDSSTWPSIDDTFNKLIQVVIFHNRPLEKLTQNEYKHFLKACLEHAYCDHSPARDEPLFQILEVKWWLSPTYVRCTNHIV